MCAAGHITTDESWVAVCNHMMALLFATDTLPEPGQLYPRQPNPLRSIIVALCSMLIPLPVPDSLH